MPPRADGRTGGGSIAAAMSARTCLNCDSPLTETARFCPRCSQRADTDRLTLVDMARDLLQRFVNVERGPVTFARALLTRPGGIAREYVEGRRRRHYGPFATLVVLAGVQALVLSMSGFRALSQEVAGVPADLLQRHFNLLQIVQLPLLGVVCAGVFRSARLNLPEHMVLVAYTLSVRGVALSITVPLALLFSSASPTLAETLGFWAAWYVYFGWAATQFYRGSRATVWLRGMVAAAIEHLAIVSLMVGVGKIYARVAGA